MMDWEEPRKRRNRLNIIAEILDTAKDGALKTQIMYKANLSFNQLKTYLELLLATRMLEETKRGNRTIYQTSPIGNKFMQSYQVIDETLTKPEERSDTRLPKTSY